MQCGLVTTGLYREVVALQRYVDAMFSAIWDQGGWLV